VKPERENGLSLIAKYLFGMGQDNRRSAVSLVVYRAQQDRMRYGDVEQLGGCLVGLRLANIAEFPRRPTAEQVKHLPLRAHAADVRLVGLESGPIDQRTLVGLAVAGIPALKQFGKRFHPKLLTNTTPAIDRMEMRRNRAVMRTSPRAQRGIR
jgi:hypothetical protein